MKYCHFKSKDDPRLQNRPMLQDGLNLWLESAFKFEIFPNVLCVDFLDSYSIK